MQGTVIHYDFLTGCGLLRAEDGTFHYFRETQLSDASFVVDNQRVHVSGNNDSLQVDTRLSTLTRPGSVTTNSLPVPATEVGATADSSDYQELLNAAPQSYQLPDSSGGSSLSGFRNWPGTLAAAVAFCLLLVAGNEAKPGRPDHTVPLLTSWWAVAAAVLLIMITYLQAIGARLLRVRLTFWLITACSGLAYFVQSYKGFQADTISEWYFYALVVLFLIIYILPYKRSQL